MTDDFALFDEVPRPWLDPEVLKARFFAISAVVHPDRVHGGPSAEKEAANRRYAELNAAYQRLRDPKERLRHLLELERGEKPNEIERIPSGAMDLLFELGGVCRAVDAFLRESARVSSPLLKVQALGKSAEWMGKLNGWLQTITARREMLMGELRTLNALWESAPPRGNPERPNLLPLDRLEQIYRELSYLTRWAAQIQDRLVQLSF